MKFKRKHWSDIILTPISCLKRKLQITFILLLPWKCLNAAKIALHSEALNLRSLQIACFSVMFPLKLDPFLASKVLRPCLPGVSRVKKIEFEYTGTPDARVVGRISEEKRVKPYKY